jgi:hypothetical protein
MFDKIPNIDLMNGLNINPIPLEFSQEMTTTKMLAAIQAKINQMIDFRNNAVSDAISYTDEECYKINKAFDELKNLINTVEIIPDGSLGIKKLSEDFLNVVNNKVIDMVKELTTTVWFGINDNGFFYAVIPESWNEITFETDVEGKLILKY